MSNLKFINNQASAQSAMLYSTPPNEYGYVKVEKNNEILYPCIDIIETTLSLPMKFNIGGNVYNLHRKYSTERLALRATTYAGSTDYKIHVYVDACNNGYILGVNGNEAGNCFSVQSTNAKFGALGYDIENTGLCINNVDLGSDSWTVEFWCKFPEVKSEPANLPGIFSCYNPDTGACCIINMAAYIGCDLEGSQLNGGHAATVAFCGNVNNGLSYVWGGYGSFWRGIWQHAAFVKNGTDFAIYLSPENGINNDGIGYSILWFSNCADIGHEFSTMTFMYDVAGHAPCIQGGSLDEIRISNIARYTGSSYTIPTAPFGIDEHTLAYSPFELGIESAIPSSTQGV